MFKKQFTFLFLTLALAPVALGGEIAGSIVDAQTGSQLIGASVLLMGTSHGASTDLDGRYILYDVASGGYDMRVSNMGYETKTVTGVMVAAHGVLKLDVSLGTSSEAFVIEDIVVSAERVMSTGVAVLAERMQSGLIGDAISADQISRSPDATSGDALKRITGLSVVDDKFVFIRGVTDRYNETLLNGVSVAGTDANVDKKSFSFDLIPANLISNTIVIKTATPDLPGDFAGGLVQINTLEFPYRRTLNLGCSISWNNLSTGEDFWSGTSGDRDWLGMDDGTRELPGGLRGNDLAQALPNNWSVSREKAARNKSFSFSYGDHRLIGGNELGFIAALTYKQGYSVNEIHESPMFDHPLLDDPFQLYDFSASEYRYSVLWGGLLNLHYKFTGRHKLSLKSNYNRSGEEKVTLGSGDYGDDEPEDHQTIEWNERDIVVNQLGGEHRLGTRGDYLLEWNLNRSVSRAEQPDRRHVEYEQIADRMQENYRTWSELDEDGWGGGLDLELPLRDGIVKLGVLLERRDRNYAADAFAALPYYAMGATSEAIDSIFSAENFTQDEGEYGPEFTFEDISVFTGEYIAEHELNAGYLMLDQSFELMGENLRFVGGLRMEDSDQQVETHSTVTAETIVSRVDEQDWLPSVNLNWMFNEKTNLRLAFSKSVNRPEFREMSDVLFYDFLRVQNVIGNPDLKRALIRNYDIRWETFPIPGEVMAVSFFYKDFTDAIEERLIPNPERFVRTWFNSPKGRNYGMELELRKSLGFLHDYLAKSHIGGNYTRIHSAIEYDVEWMEDLGDSVVIHSEVREREMQGQAPWTINFSLFFVEPNTDISVSLLFNRIGRRLDAVADNRFQDEYEEPLDMLDLAIAKTFANRYKVKFTAKNLKDEDQTFTQSSEGLPFRSIHKGKSYSLSVGLNL